MQFCKYQSADGVPSVGLIDDELITPLNLTGSHYQDLTDLLNDNDPLEATRLLVDPSIAQLPLADVTLLPPIDRQEVWGAGVTYKRSKAARMEESVGAASFYDKVYDAPRPELFFKSMPHRAVGHGMNVRIRNDGKWNVPEPELVLVLNMRLDLIGFTIGNDMSCRDIEGENPLYLPQAKTYDQSCAIGPYITLASKMPPRQKIGIRMGILRNGVIAYEGKTSIAQMNRTFEDLIGYLGRDNTFRDGVYLFTGTGIVPDSDFTLLPGDVVHISIDGIGTLVNPVVQS